MKEKTELAVYYERVSTHHVEQEESMENQRALAQSYLRRHPEIKLAEPLDTFSEKISGKNDDRPRYKEMLRRLERNDVRYVLVKDFKRLNRSTELSAQIRNHSKEYNYKFILLSTGQIFDPNDSQNRMMYGFESLVNEDYVYRQSEYARLAHRQKCEAKKLNRNNVTFGFKWDFEKQKIVIDEEKAQIVREIFNLYVFQNYGILEIRRYLASLGYHYCGNTVSNWLRETAFIGVFHINKKGSELGVGAGKKTKRYTNPIDEWVRVERPDLVILDKKIFDLAQDIRENRAKRYDSTKRNNVPKQDRYKGTHIFAAKIFCAECGYPFVHSYSDRKQQIGVYKDTFNSRNKNALEVCSNKNFKRVYEEDMISITVKAINGMISNNDDCFGLLLEVLESVLRNEDTRAKQIKDKKAEIKRLVKQSKNILEQCSSTLVTGALLESLNEKYNSLNERIEVVKEEIVEMEKDTIDETSIRDKITEISGVIGKWKLIEADEINRKMVENFIDKILVHKDGLLEIILHTKEVVKAELPENTGQKKRRKASSDDKQYVYGKSDYKEQLCNIVKMMLMEHNRTTNLVTMLRFVHREEVGNIKTGKKKSFCVAIEINILA